MCDEYTNFSNKQQLSMCVRWIDDSLNPHEDFLFLGFYKLPNIVSDTIVYAMLLGAVKEKFEIDNDDSLEQNDSLGKRCTRRWTVRVNAFNKVINNFGPLFELWDICLGDKLDKESCSRMLGCKSQMTGFRFFFGINLAYRMYSITDNL